MKLMTLIIFNAVVESAMLAADGPAWTYVPAARENRSLWGFELETPPVEDVVTLVSSVKPAVIRQPERGRVFAVEIADPHDGRTNAQPSDEALTNALPEGVRWPGADGRIIAGSVEQSGAATGRGVRNPWEVYIRAKAVGREIVFECGGIVIGGEGGAVAILNGRIVKKGDAVGEFGVAGILAKGVLLGRDGSCFVIPLGRHTTVAIASD